MHITEHISMNQSALLRVRKTNTCWIPTLVSTWQAVSLLVYFRPIIILVGKIINLRAGDQLGLLGLHFPHLENEGW